MIQNKKTKLSDIAAEILYREKIKDAVYKRNSRKERASTKFLKRYEQNLQLVFANKGFIPAIHEIRRKLNIPRDGFDIYAGDKEFKKWLTAYKKKFIKIQAVLAQYKEFLETHPKDVFAFYISAVLDGENIDIYYRKDSFIETCPTLEIYKNYINEKPFPGIFEFILFDEFFLPQNNLTSLFLKDNYLLLAISASTTKKDLEELWTEINQWQKNMASYSKNKKRLKKNLTEGLEAIAYDQETDDQITTEKLEGEAKKRRVAMRNLDLVDQKIYNGKSPIKPNLTKEKQFRRKRNKIKSQVRKLVGTN